jgi:hypothetical protein
MNTLFEIENYKVLTLYQPWASLLVHGIKKIETRQYINEPERSF